MIELQSAMYLALTGAGYTGTLNDMLLQWAQFNGATADQLNDAIQEVLVLQGAPANYRQIDDAWYYVLGALGYTGSMTDRMTDFWFAGGVFSGYPAGTLFAVGGIDPIRSVGGTEYIISI